MEERAADRPPGRPSAGPSTADERNTMIDQAAELRKLVLRAMRERTATVHPPPKLLLMAGGNEGVGVTTLAVNLAVGLGEQGARVVVVDADLHRSDVSALCGIHEHANVLDLLIARRDIHEVLQRGPAGIQVVPGLWTPGQKLDWTQAAQERLFRQFRNLGLHADVVVLDVGSGSSEFIRRCAAAADEILLVTTPASAAVLESYAQIKASLRNDSRVAPGLIVNRCGDAQQAALVHQRIDESCQRFLGMGVGLRAYVPDDDAVRRTRRHGAAVLAE